MKKNNFGFTLVELLLVSALLSVIALAIYATFSSGVEIWQRVNKQLPGEDLNIFFDKFGSDLRNSFKFTGIDFLGREDMVEFSTLVNSPRMNKRTVGGIIYFYDSETGVLNREQRDFAQIYSAQNGTIVQSLENIKSLKFRYYFYDKQKKEYLWQDQWESEELPLAVSMELEVGNSRHPNTFPGTSAPRGTGGHRQNNKFVKTVSIPVGG